MLSAWIKIFEPENEIAANVASQWAEIAEKRSIADDMTDMPTWKPLPYNLGESPKADLRQASACSTTISEKN
nr:hypothetical protein [uncultured Acetatifactor sp.]